MKESYRILALIEVKIKDKQLRVLSYDTFSYVFSHIISTF